MIRYESTPAPGTPVQRWLRRHIATLERIQRERVAAVAEQKKVLDASIVRAQRELDSFRAHQTIGSVR